MAHVIRLTENFIAQAELTGIQSQVLVNVANGHSGVVGSNVPKSVFHDLKEKFGLVDMPSFRRGRGLLAAVIQGGCHVSINGHTVAKVRNLPFSARCILQGISEGLKSGEIAERNGFANENVVKARTSQILRDLGAGSPNNAAVMDSAAMVYSSFVYPYLKPETPIEVILASNACEM